MLIERLQKTFAERARKNPQYSLRAFARALDIDSSTLSALLRRKRPLTAKTARKLIASLDIKDPAEIQSLLLGTLEAEAGISQPAYDEMALEAAEAISSWEHYAILALLEIGGFTTTTRSVAARLNLPQAVAMECLQRLAKLGLVAQQGDSWKLTAKNLASPANVPSAAIREALRQYMEKAMVSLEKDPISVRDMTGTTIAIDPDKLPAARKLIREFRHKLSAFLEDGHKRSVYRLNVQLFPLTQEEK
jgi:predicted transcriptional regulator